jgi:hypothetical protein
VRFWARAARPRWRRTPATRPRRRRPRLGFTHARRRRPSRWTR